MVMVKHAHQIALAFFIICFPFLIESQASTWVLYDDNSQDQSFYDSSKVLKDKDHILSFWSKTTPGPRSKESLKKAFQLKNDPSHALILIKVDCSTYNYSYERVLIYGDSGKIIDQVDKAHVFGRAIPDSPYEKLFEKVCN